MKNKEGRKFGWMDSKTTENHSQHTEKKKNTEEQDYKNMKTRRMFCSNSIRVVVLLYYSSSYCTFHNRTTMTDDILVAFLRVKWRHPQCIPSLLSIPMVSRRGRRQRVLILRLSGVTLCVVCANCVIPGSPHHPVCNKFW